jgi:hypothetical protein
MNESLWKSRFIESMYETLMRHGVDVLDALASAQQLAEKEYPGNRGAVPELIAALACRNMLGDETVKPAARSNS